MWRPLLLVAGAHVLIYSEWIDALPSDSEVSVKCSPLVDPSRLIKCQLNKQEVDCDKPMTAGTKASVTCKSYYTQIAELAKYETTCQSDGKWFRPIQSCVPRCGETKPSTLFHGYHYWWYLNKKTQESAVEVPWHAGIYREFEGNNILICGGSIISERVIVTNAHCFWDETSSTKRDEKFFKIAAGKLYHDWYTDEPYVQKREIDTTILHPCFRGSVRNYVCDISLVKLKEPLTLNNEVLPICIDFAKNFETQFTPGMTGVVVGWGGNQTEVYSKKLRKVTLPYIKFEQCERGVPTSFLQFLTVDKFCAGYLNGTSLCPGESGGGFATKFRDGKWYLMGIVSVSLAQTENNNCNVNAYTGFTKVSSYYDFISSLV